MKTNETLENEKPTVLQDKFKETDSVLKSVLK